MRRTMVVSVFAGCGKTWLANHQNKYGYSMRDSDSSTYVYMLSVWVLSIDTTAICSEGNIGFIVIGNHSIGIINLRK